MGETLRQSSNHRLELWESELFQAKDPAGYMKTVPRARRSSMAKQLMLNGVLQKLESLASVLQSPVLRVERRRSSAILEIQNVYSVRSICGCADLPRRKHFSEYMNDVLSAFNHELVVKECFFIHYS